MGQFVGHHVEGAGEVVPLAAAGRDAGRQPFAVHHDAVAGVEGVQVVQVQDRARRARPVLAPHRMHEARHREVAVVEPLAVEPLVEVVVGPAGVRVGVDGGRVGPLVVGVGRDVAVVERQQAVQVRLRPGEVALQVVRPDGWRAHAVEREVGPVAQRRADLLGVVEHALAGPDRRLQVAVPQHQRAGAGVDEVDGEVVGGQHAHAVGEGVPALVARQHDQLRGAIRADRHPGHVRDDGRRILRTEHRLDVEVDAGVERAEDRDGLPAIRLPDQLAAEHADALVVLVEAFVGAAVEHQVRLLTAGTQPPSRSMRVICASHTRTSLASAVASERRPVPDWAEGCAGVRTAVVSTARKPGTGDGPLRWTHETSGRALV